MPAGAVVPWGAAASDPASSREIKTPAPVPAAAGRLAGRPAGHLAADSPRARHARACPRHSTPARAGFPFQDLPPLPVSESKATKQRAHGHIRCEQLTALFFASYLSAACAQVHITRQLISKPRGRVYRGQAQPRPA